MGALDRNKISDLEAVRILVPIAVALGEDPSLLSISRTTLQRKRKKARHEIAEELKINFNPKYPIVVNWDRKILPDIKGKGTVDRLAIITSGNDDEKLLGVPKLTSGTGENIAEAIYSSLEQWYIVAKVQGMSFDFNKHRSHQRSMHYFRTESGPIINVVSLSSSYAGTDISEIIYFIFGPSSSPEISLYKRFKTVWNGIERD
ncbi:hypothetical protein AVEN_166936-1 [Araneus ventricosus]|uniref:Uncharacterized protein n=1 Tax=Araneus ventricosus TaxID=182803 RepID=A0A4Y2LMU1_ARAVE|nr:hypothetical protein AVEN_166936-1 [Araneus ventricosus]